MRPRVLVLGATGQVGLFAVAKLLGSGREIVAVSRRVTEISDTALDGLSKSSLGGAVRLLRAGRDRFALLSCGPVPLAVEVLRASGKGSDPGLERVVVTGTTSIHSKRNSMDAGERALIAEIEAALARMLETCQMLDVPLSVLHPTMIYGCGMDRNLSRVYHWIERFGFAPVARNATGLRQPLHVADLARTLAGAVTADPATRLDSPVCGGAALPYEEVIGRLFEAAGRPRRMLRLPGWSYGLMASMGALLSGGGSVNAEMFRRQSLDLVFDDTAARHVLGHSSRAFQPVAADFRLPPEVDRIRRALA